MEPGELAALMLKVGSADLMRAMVKAADAAGIGGMPKAPSFGQKPRDQSGGLTPTQNLVPRQPAPSPDLDRTRPESVAAQKTIAPPPVI